MHLDGSAAAALRPLWSGVRTWSIPAVGRASRPARWSTACGQAVWPRHRRRGQAGAVRPVATRPVGCCWGCWARVDTGPRRHQRRRAARTVRCPGCPLTRRRLRPAHRPGPGRHCLPSGGHRRQGGHPGRAAWHDPGLDRQIAGLEAEMAPLPARTQDAKLTQLRGVGVVAAAGLVALVGCTDRWADWSKVWRAAGLDPARSQSGPTDARLGISREGSAWGRRAILDLAAAVCQQPGPDATACAPAPTSSTNPPRSPWRPLPTPTGAPCLRSWPPAPTTTPPTRPREPSGRQVVKPPEPEDTGGLPGPIRRRCQAIRPDLAHSLAPAPWSFLQTADAASCGQTAHAIHQRAGVRTRPEASQIPSTDRDRPGRPYGPTNLHARRT